MSTVAHEEKKPAVRLINRSVINVRPKSLLTPHHRHGKPIQSPFFNNHSKANMTFTFSYHVSSILDFTVTQEQKTKLFVCSDVCVAVRKYNGKVISKQHPDQMWACHHP